MPTPVLLEISFIYIFFFLVWSPPSRNIFIRKYCTECWYNTEEGFYILDIQHLANFTVYFLTKDESKFVVTSVTKHWFTIHLDFLNPHKHVINSETGKVHFVHKIYIHIQIIFIMWVQFPFWSFLMSA